MRSEFEISLKGDWLAAITFYPFLTSNGDLDMTALVDPLVNEGDMKWQQGELGGSAAGLCY